MAYRLARNVYAAADATTDMKRATRRLPKMVKSEIDLAIYHFGKHGLQARMERCNSKRPLGYLTHLVGKILYCHSIGPAFGCAAMAALREALAQNRELLETTMAFDPVSAVPDSFDSLYRIIFS